MSNQILPVTSDPNQTFQSTLSVDGKNITLSFFFRFNEMAQYWTMSVTDAKTGSLLLDSIPILAADSPANNILSQFAYLGIGSMYLVNVSNTPNDVNGSNLGSDYLIFWGDTPSA